MSKQKKIALSSLMVALLLVGTMGIVALAGTGNRSYCSIGTSYNSKYGSYVTMDGSVSILVTNMSSSTRSLVGSLQNSAGIAEWGSVSASIGNTASDTVTASNEKCRMALFGYYKCNGTGSARN